jgi:cytochrome P450
MQASSHEPGQRGVTLPPIPAVSRFRSFADSPAMARNPVQVLSKYAEDFGDTFRFYLGGLKEVIVTTDPVVIQHVLKTNAENYQKSEIQVKRMGHFLGKGLLTTHGDAWRTQRRLIQKGFAPRQLDALSSIMQDSLAESVRDFDSQIGDGPVDIYPHLMKMTFAMVARSLFGAKLKDEDISLVSDTICTVQEFIVRQTLQPYLNPWFAASGELRRHEEMRVRADSILMAYIKQRRNQEPGNDLLQTLMDARYTDGEGMSDELVLSESMQLGDEPLSHGHVPRFEFTVQVIQEGLRLYPPFWMIDRVAVEDDRAGEIDIPKGSTVIVYVYGAHHAPRYWDNPERFDPERFTKANDKLRTPFTHLPFGGGPRGCIGNHYAMLQMLMILSVVLRRYDFQLIPGQTIEERAMVILRPKHGIRMAFTRAIARDQHAVMQD